MRLWCVGNLMNSFSYRGVGRAVIIIIVVVVVAAVVVVVVTAVVDVAEKSTDIYIKYHSGTKVAKKKS